MLTLSILQQVTINVPVPKSQRDSRRILESASGFVQNLPIPTIHKRGCDGYSFVLPSLVLEMKLLFGVELECVSLGDMTSRNPSIIDERSLFGFDIIKDKLKDLDQEHNDTIIVPFGLWSDEFDAGKLSKANRNTVKLTTIHICHPKSTKDHVAPIAFGKNKSDHEAIREILWNDIIRLTGQSWNIFVPKFNVCKRVRFVMAYMIQDRPEHSDWTGFSSHAGLFSTIVGVSSPVYIKGSPNDEDSDGFVVMKQLASCASCYRKRREMYINKGPDCGQSTYNCPNCDDWDIMLCEFKPHPDYPTTSPFYQERMGAKEITFQTMRSACELIWKMVYERKWKRSEVSRFGQYECLKRETITNIWESAKESRPSANQLIGEISAPRMPIDCLPSGMRQNVLKLKDCIVGIMHTLVLNIGRHLFLSIIALLKERKLWNQFRDRSEELLFFVQSKSLSWCKTWTYGSEKKPASVWVSENFLGFSIIGKSLSSMIHSTDVGECGHIQLIHQVLSSYHCLVSMVMSPFKKDDHQCDEVTLMTKLFLSHFKELETKISTRTTSKIESAASLLNILPMGEEMKRFGIMRNYWEGSMNGEAYIQVMKPHVKRGVELTGTATAAMKKCYQQSGLHLMRTDLLQSLSNDNTTAACCETSSDSAERYRRFHPYKDIFEVEELLTDRCPLAAFFDPEKSEFYILLGWGAEKSSVIILLTDFEKRISTTVCDVTITNIGGSFTDADFDKDHGRLISILLLPIMAFTEESSVDIKTLYCVHSEHHLELSDDDMEFEVPSLYLSDIEVTPSDQQHARVANQNYEVFDITDRELCQSFVGKYVNHTDGFSIGEVIDFKYKHNRKTFDDAVWTVEYRLDGLHNLQRSRKEEISYVDIMQRLLG